VQIITDTTLTTRTLKRRAGAALVAVLSVNDGEAAVVAGESAGCQMAQRRPMRSSARLTARLIANTRTPLQVTNPTLCSSEVV
jgi:hypothetical protein